MPDIVLATLNAKFIHASFGLRYLLANLGELRPRAALAEFTIHERPLDVAERLLAHEPRIVGLGVYIWNVAPTTELVALLKKLRPGLVVVLGGPEVSHETDAQEIVRLADYTITGEGDLAFARLSRAILAGERPAEKIIAAPLPALADLALPYDEYTDADIAHRLIYVEASRGCPFECEFCLSSLDLPVRQFPLAPFLAALDRLLARGVQHFKFVDRTFNLNLAVSRSILEFFLARLRPGLFLHFEMIPDRLPPALRELIAKFPAGMLQFEVGIQTFDPEVAARISRRQDYGRLEENFRFLREQTGVHVHADLIAGLPGETLASFAAGFDRLVAMRPQEIQVGILKRLRGTPIVRHDAEWGVVWSPLPPYELLQNRLLDFATMQRLRRFARDWDLVGNSGNFVETLPLFWRDEENGASPFAEFMRFSDWFHAREGRHHGIALARLVERVFEFLVHERGQPAPLVANALARDARRTGRRDVPPALRPHVSAELQEALAAAVVAPAARLTHRQAKHSGAQPAPAAQ
jgi:radical SAM superfamily enzyme YgiQ (UPF0313 family)